MKVVLFGVFDLFHKGHKYFLEHASTYGDEVYIILTLDEVVKKLKNRIPIDNYITRKENILDYTSSLVESKDKKSKIKFNVVPCDKELGTYTILQQIKPDIICFGYDQSCLKEDLMKRIDNKSVNCFARMVYINGYETNIYSSSILREKIIHSVDTHFFQHSF